MCRPQGKQESPGWRRCKDRYLKICNWYMDIFSSLPPSKISPKMSLFKKIAVETNKSPEGQASPDYMFLQCFWWWLFGYNFHQGKRVSVNGSIGLLLLWTLVSYSSTFSSNIPTFVRSLLCPGKPLRKAWEVCFLLQPYAYYIRDFAILCWKVLLTSLSSLLDYKLSEGRNYVCFYNCT